ncbi:MULTISPECIES: hypothetical protein [unclassified Pseudofrankia]|uniref:hypothetical protein n=1 Tax=unclassified Pseudofrankia TaxID=2994372 RepID=UPI0008DB0D16|nr:MULTISPECIES: hypothetical protein [unclassified Pseudofrankia]MDT3445607.1 hypothetical protein [Pseudofrankia sp. BMG5.37]OHV63544.1 hypothetical protein BCD48_38125 [Pseudofrankia sp. BMG5.36]
MFGTDYLHPESTWPNTREYIRETMRDVPEDEVRLILGENMIKFYGLDRPALEAAALRCGPLPSDLLGSHQQVDPAMVDHFHARSGIRKAMSLPMDRFTKLVQDDVGRVLADAAS